MAPFAPGYAYDLDLVFSKLMNLNLKIKKR